MRQRTVLGTKRRVSNLDTLDTKFKIQNHKRTDRRDSKCPTRERQRPGNV